MSMPPDVDLQIATAAAEARMSYSAWLAATARKEFTIRAGLDAVEQFEHDQGAFSPEEMIEAEEWAREAVARSHHSGSPQRRSA